LRKRFLSPIPLSAASLRTEPATVSRRLRSRSTTAYLTGLPDKFDFQGLL